MDGWGPPAQKVTTYRAHVAPAAIPYRGFKLFYRNDRRDRSRMMPPEEVLVLTPAPDLHPISVWNWRAGSRQRGVGGHEGPSAAAGESLVVALMVSLAGDRIG